MKYFHNARDPWSSFTHLIGAGLAAVGTVVLLVFSFNVPLHRASAVASCLIFGCSMVALYGSSALYHYVKGTAEKIKKLRKLDHSMIYVLIAGTYTPVLLLAVGGKTGIIFTAVIWAMAFSGIFMKLCWLNAPRWLYTSVYLLMGWAIVFYYPALKAISALPLTFIAGGGVAYSVGAVIYILKKPNICEGFGFHEIFHLLIMLGSALHFAAVFMLLF
ncbi:MAG: hemolysin III family protein [Oscillospiraceae bacterium]|nr:hemolysin III family protein [Oscillospiraceae bacterium]